MSDNVFVEVVRKDIDGASFHRGLVMDFSGTQVRDIARSLLAAEEPPPLLRCTAAPLHRPIHT